MRPLDNFVHVDVAQGGTAHTKGVRRCGGVWVCPACAPTVREQRASDIDRGVAAWLAGGNDVWFVTATIRHTKDDALADSLGLLQTMWSEAWAGDRGKDFRTSNGIVGSIRSIEITWGHRNGFHPHIHGLVFAERGRFGVLDMVAQWNDRWWAHGLQDYWVPNVSIDVRPVVSNDAISGYLAQVEGGWGAGLELARADLKKGSGITPDQLLELAHTGEKKWVQLWAEYEAATKGRRFIVWSRGLRDLLGINEPELSDEDAAAGPDPVVVVAHYVVPKDVWCQWLNRGQLGDFLQALIRCEGERLGATLIRPEPPPWPYGADRAA